MNQPANSHTVVSSGIELTDRLRELIYRAQSRDPLHRVTVITPGYFSSFYLRRWLASSGLINVEFVRIEDFADALALDALNQRSGKAMTRVEATELVRSAVDRCISSGLLPPSIARIAGQSSFLAAVHRTLGELEAQANNDQIALSELPGANQTTRAVGVIWEAYKRLKQERGLYDRTQVASEAVVTLRAGRLNTETSRADFGQFIVLAAATPAPHYVALWQDLIALPSLQTITVTSGDETDDRLLSSAYGITGMPPSNELNFPPALAVSATDIRSEIAAVVRRIANDAEDGVPFNRMAVVYGDPAYAARIRSALDIAGITPCGPPRDTLSSSPVGRFVNRLLAIISSSYARRQVGDWLATCAVRDPASGNPVTGAEWDRITSAARAAGEPSVWASQLTRYAASLGSRANSIERRGDDESGSPLAAEALRREQKATTHLSVFLESLFADLRLPGSSTGWREWTQWLQVLVTRYLYTPEDSDARASEDRLKTVLERIAGLDQLNTSPPDFGRFSGAVTRAFSEHRSGENRLGSGVFVGSVSDAAATRFERLHVVGMTDGSFPSADSPDPLLPDGVKELLNRVAGTSLPLATERRARQRRQFLAALGSADRVTLYWSRSGGQGAGDAGPAQWLIEQVRRHAGNEALQASDLLQRPASIAGVDIAAYASDPEYADEHEHLVASVRHHAVERAPSSQHWLEQDAASGVPLALALETGRFGTQFTEWSGDVSGVKSGPVLGGETLSASRVESFATCPLRYFFGYVLSVSPGTREDDSFHMAPDRRGTFIHSVLESYLNLRLADERPAGESTLDEAMERAREQEQQKFPGTTGRIWQLETEEIRRQLRRWLAQERIHEEQGYRPKDAELSFGRARASAAEQLSQRIEVVLSDGTVVRFSGMIDRVDRHEDDSYLVFDYKSGRADGYKSITDDPVDRGRHLQLAIYSRAVREIHSPTGKVSAAYWFVMDRDQEILPDLSEYDPALAETRLLDVLETLKRTNEDGFFPPNPGKRGSGPGGDAFENCGYCDFNRVCPSATRREQMLTWHSRDPRLAAYFNMATGEPGGDE